ncbi:hypothetical protein ACQYRI_04245 [Salmonella enterica]
MKKMILPCTLMALAISAKAQTLPESLLHCDSRFFSELYTQQIQLKHTAPLETDKQRHAWYAAPKSGETIWFAQPLQLQQLTITGYYQQKSDLQEFGTYYYWGLIFAQSPETVAAALPKANWQKSGESFFLNPMIKRPGDKNWRSNSAAASGIAPAKGSVEKLAILDSSNGKTQLLCSIQGAVTDEDLFSLRPDLRGGNK